jgi:hypothetical protein
MANTIKIGTTYGTLATFASYSIREPVPHPVVPYAQLDRVSSGKVVARGLPQAMLTWPGVLSTSERTALRNIVAGASANVYLQIPNEAYTDTLYTGIASWPERTPENSQTPSFELLLSNLVVYVP